MCTLRGRGLIASLGLWLFGLLLLAVLLTACSGPAPTPPAEHTLTVNVTGNGSVTSSPPGINNCTAIGGTCTATYPEGEEVTLTATPVAGAAFDGWDGACSDYGDNPTCVVTMNSNQLVTATFSGPDLNPGEKPISGTIENWAEGIATVRALALVGPGEVVGLAEGTINADGTFSLTLPGGEVMGEYLFTVPSNLCEIWGGTGTIEVTPDPLQLGPTPRFFVYSPGNDDPVGFLDLQGGDESVFMAVEQQFSASSGAIQGSCTFEVHFPDGTVGTATETYDVNLTAGWNDLISVFTATTANIRTGAIPAGVNWQYIPFQDQQHLGVLPTIQTVYYRHPRRSSPLEEHPRL